MEIKQNELSNLTDYDLIKEYQITEDNQKKSDIVDVLCKRYRKLIIQKVSSLKNTKNFIQDSSLSGEDLFQELFLVIYKALEWTDYTKIKIPQIYYFYKTFDSYLRSYQKLFREKNKVTLCPIIEEECNDSLAYTDRDVDIDSISFNDAFKEFMSILDDSETIIVENICNFNIGQKRSIKNKLSEILHNNHLKSNNRLLNKQLKNIQGKFMSVFISHGFFKDENIQFSTCIKNHFHSITTY